LFLDVEDLTNKVHTRIMAAEDNSKGVAFDVILKPAAGEGPPVHHHGSPVKERPISQADIERELQEAEEKRLAHLQAKQERLKEHDRHAEQVRQKKLSQAESGEPDDD
jgi:hypothetical protein